MAGRPSWVPQFRYGGGESEKGDRAHRGSEDNEIILGSAGWQQEEKEMGGWEGYEGEAGRLGTCKFTTPSCP